MAVLPIGFVDGKTFNLCIAQATLDALIAFQHTHRRVSGLIIVQMQLEEPFDCPYYWSSEWQTWNKFNDPNRSENPKTYKNFPTLIRSINRLEMGYHNDSDKLVIVPAFWVHPDADFQALDKYKVMLSGHHFPGSPRR